MPQGSETSGCWILAVAVPAVSSLTSAKPPQYMLPRTCPPHVIHTVFAPQGYGLPKVLAFSLWLGLPKAEPTQLAVLRVGPHDEISGLAISVSD